MKTKQKEDIIIDTMHLEFEKIRFDIIQLQLGIMNNAEFNEMMKRIEELEGSFDMVLRYINCLKK